ncbi:MAG TPA: 2,3-bisphosphoglycerate-independent phosphoglycerate mutase [Candidatus Aerophobetes bacterium]|uniref:2,3-bisphosphoglycerate-independent phosphoglycerate mutase n=1 Tax=Aerophobetes bacterium TaxID=2030807 RepID=A0A7V5M0N9_UNCAE|nr:2,3-bisphosphoglycerate-independent phosphoglycerate mutase [Candidatus Aerophobetes bacterium]
MIERKVFFVVADGMGDRAVKNGKTPLQLARKKFLDELAAEGSTGIMSTIGPGIVPGSDTAHLALFGYDPSLYYKGRGPFEALGVGLELREGDVAFRCNFATVDENFQVIDRRAGRLKDEGAVLAKSLQGIKIDGVEVIFASSTEHRGVLILRGEGLSPAVSDTDPHSPQRIPPLESKPLDTTPEAKKTASIVNKFVRKSWEILRLHPLNKEREKEGRLPANILLTRGAGIYQKVKSLGEKYGITSCCIAGSALYKGVARYVGMDVLSVEGATGRIDTDIEAKANAAKKALEKYDFIFIHVKGADNASHDGDLEKKLLMIGKIDRLAGMLKDEDALLVITADHSTPISVKRHSADPVPVLIYGKGVRKDKVTSFDEVSVAYGCLGYLTGIGLHNTVMDFMGCAHMVGS